MVFLRHGINHHPAADGGIVVTGAEVGEGGGEVVQALIFFAAKAVAVVGAEEGGVGGFGAEGKVAVLLYDDVRERGGCALAEVEYRADVADVVLGEPAVAPGVGRFIIDEPSFFRTYTFKERIAIISHPVYERPDVQIFVIIIVHDHVLCPVCKICVVKNHIAVVIHAAGQVKEIVGIFQTGKNSTRFSSHQR